MSRVTVPPGEKPGSCTARKIFEIPALLLPLTTDTARREKRKWRENKIPPRTGINKTRYFLFLSRNLFNAHGGRAEWWIIFRPCDIYRARFFWKMRENGKIFRLVWFTNVSNSRFITGNKFPFYLLVITNNSLMIIVKCVNNFNNNNGECVILLQCIFYLKFIINSCCVLFMIIKLKQFRQ